VEKDKEFHFTDNRRVKTGKWGSEFFAIWFCTEPDWPYGKANVFRYCVPGRCDTYSFHRSNSQLCYYSEGSIPITLSLKMLAKDIDTDECQKMILEAIEIPDHYSYARQLVEDLLPMIVPKSTTLKCCEKRMVKIIEEHHLRVRAREAAREAYKSTYSAKVH
jgi:hypothetical protein